MTLPEACLSRDGTVRAAPSSRIRQMTPTAAAAAAVGAGEEEKEEREHEGGHVPDAQEGGDPAGDAGSGKKKKKKKVRERLGCSAGRR